MKETLSSKIYKGKTYLEELNVLDVKECFKRIELKMLKRFKSASIPMLKIIKEELGEELVK